MRTCSKCCTSKGAEKFYYDKRRNSFRRECKECTKVVANRSNKAWQKNNPVSRKKSGFKSKLKANYGLSLEQFTTMLEVQGKSCAICKHPLSLDAVTKSDRPHVDHCHVSGVVRGLLCLTCNTGLGMFDDSEDLLDSAKLYLRSSRGTATVKGDPVTASVNADSQK